MKRIIIIAFIAASLSLGFTVVNNATEKVPAPKLEKQVKTNFSNKSDEKRLASWD
ncbi:MAG: hypothetical protein WBJ10_01185 [Daejeonella sp.]|uniref:hypothetical protein n=1 Tax=Daejeonella sp. TaxID=2805397 RepID=UPI003C754BFC